MKERMTQLTARYQRYSPREKQLIKLCAAALCSAAVWYGGVAPLDKFITASQNTINRQRETLNWMRAEINRNHLQARQLRTSNPRRLVENSAKSLHFTLRDIRQQAQTLSFSIERVNVYALKNWLLEMNYTSGIQLDKIDLKPVDRVSDVSVQISLSWKKAS